MTATDQPESTAALRNALRVFLAVHPVAAAGLRRRVTHDHRHNPDEWRPSQRVPGWSWWEPSA
jgi:hypothetical protein